MFIYLGWIIAAFLGGFIAAFMLKKRRPSLRKNFSRIENFTGRGYREIISIADAKPSSEVHLPDGTVLRTWCDEAYSITLKFDCRDVCLGVVEEQY